MPPSLSPAAPPARCWRVAIVLALGSGMLACAEPELARAERVRFGRPAGGELRQEEERVIERFQLGPERAPWSALAERASIETIPWKDAEVELGGRYQVLQDPRRRRIELPGPFDGGAFDRVRVGALVLGPQRMLVEVVVAGERIQSPAVELRREGPRRIEVDFPSLRLGAGVVERVSITFAGEAKGVGVASVELVRRPLVGDLGAGAYLPGDGLESSFVELGGDARVARVLSSEAPLVASAVLPESSLLSLATGLPEAVRALGEGATLVLRASCGGEQREFTRTLSAQAGSSWRMLRVRADELRPDALAREAVELELRLTTATGERALVVVSEAHVLRPAADAPRVVLITSDTHRADHLGLLAEVAVHTPELDRLAARGVRFLDAWAPANSTQPSHAAMLTGLDPRDSGVTYNGKRMSASIPTLAERFRERGYLTLAATSAAHLHGRISGLWRGFARASAPATDQRDSDETLAQLESWLVEAEGLPLFVWLHIFDAHGPYEAPERYWRDLYEADRDPYSAELERPAPEHLPDWNRSVRDLDYLRALYSGEVRYLDERVGRLLRRPELADAWIAFAGDHGESLPGDRPPWFNHIGISPATLAVPLLLAGPGIEGPRVVERGVSITDLGRTLLDLADLQGARFPGRNLLAEGEERPRFALESKARSASLRLGSWFLVLDLWSEPRAREPGRPRHATRLFDLAADPGAMTDVSEREPGRVRALRAQLVQWLAAAPAWTRAGRSRAEEATLDELRGLGYAEGAPGTSPLFDAHCDCEDCLRHR